MSAQAPDSREESRHALKGITISMPTHNVPAIGDAKKTAQRVSSVVSATPVPSWTYTVTAYDGKSYSGPILGLSPYNHGKTTTTIPIQIVPLVITITDSNGSVVYDPTAADACVPGHSGVDIIANSPLFINGAWTMDGVNAGTTQYEDANVRTEFWSLLGSTPYHLTAQEITLAGQALSFGSGGTSGRGANYTATSLGSCEGLGVVDIDDMDNALQSLIAGSLAGQVNVGTFPLFVTKNVVMAEGGTSLYDCCILGYHSSFNVGPNLQIYGPFDVDTAGIFGSGYTSAMSHEVGEAIHDPSGDSPTPVWGNEGQVVGTCQNNFEVGDALSEGFGTPSNAWVVPETNGLTYNLQELVFFNWFFGDPNLAEPNHYSNHGTFTGYAKSVPSGRNEPGHQLSQSNL